ncbi:hypothetical protein DAPPUDRAFT_259112 [Daphnia pulex]|uniref:Uncharacterized protein n=1 Tax=Daphnia pulex TaxID=6669 RepID=E9HGK6_DAPPU|nr:hypothetical protein DAPPUDRAFT_259112 [Daphnia pulex]|eukprot:EFX69101.1 hypothetical protein DAPPUDRAFT_259112 [Daphnia pulex]
MKNYLKIVKIDLERPRKQWNEMIKNFNLINVMLLLDDCSLPQEVIKEGENWECIPFRRLATISLMLSFSANVYGSLLVSNPVDMSKARDSNLGQVG